MKRFLLSVTIVCCFFTLKSFAQSERIPGPAEKKITDSLCATLSKVDISKINSVKEAQSVFMDCFMKQSAMFEDVANERNVQMDDKNAMHQLGEDIGKNLLKEKCDAFLKISMKMAEKGGNDSNAGNTTGNFKRIDLKGFNYVVIKDQNGLEKSFLWLKEFSGSENFMGVTSKYLGKRMTIKWEEIEVYLPLAKGYYKVKEITGIDVL